MSRPATVPGPLILGDQEATRRPAGAAIRLRPALAPRQGRTGAALEPHTLSHRRHTGGAPERFRVPIGDRSRRSDAAGARQHTSDPPTAHIRNQRRRDNAQTDATTHKQTIRPTRKRTLELQSHLVCADATLSDTKRDPDRPFSAPGIL